MTVPLQTSDWCLKLGLSPGLQLPSNSLSKLKEKIYLSCILNIFPAFFFLPGMTIILFKRFMHHLASVLHASVLTVIFVTKQAEAFYLSPMVLLLSVIFSTLQYKFENKKIINAS